MKQVKCKVIWLFSFMILLDPATALARHIIGSDFYYVCQGQGRTAAQKRYSFHLDVYRDCSTTILFNPNAAFGIYTYSPTRGYRLYDQFNVQHGTIRSVKPDQNPCIIIPPNVCVETTDYEFTVDLPITDETYVIYYIQCCRNRTILNIPNPGNTGSTFFIEITGEAQRLCNSSPRFKAFPPIVICANFPLVFDHSATDQDGDSLAYEFCPLLAGGGPGGGPILPGQLPGCTTPTPDPRVCPPPFNTLPSNPGFSYTDPLGPSIIHLDPMTGMLTGNPKELGQYVVGVCVKEFRNGVQIGAIHRDFQFNVAICEQAVHAKIKADSINNSNYFINYCGNNDIQFTNESYQAEYIKDYYWEFKSKVNPNNVVTSTEKDPKLSFPIAGQYNGVMIVNKNALICNDTVRVNLNIIPSDINADFSYEYDKCSSAAIKFTDMSTGKLTPVKTYSWDFGNLPGSTLKSPSHLFDKPGNYDIKLTVTDGKLCKSVKSKPLAYFPSPALLDILPDKFRACAPAVIRFNNLSVPVDSTYDVTWEFGDGTSLKGVNATHVYKSPGLYTIKLSLKAPSGCINTESFPNFIRVTEGPTAAFDYNPQEPSTKDPTVVFTNKSKSSVSYTWDFGDNSGSSITHPVHTYKDTGQYVIYLIAKHENGCTDSALQSLRVGLYITYFLPNAFTPNNDGINDTYYGTGALEGMTEFSLSIYNRWGEQIFRTKDPTEGWNGKKNNQGNTEPDGVYVCIVQYKDDRGNPHELKGFATLIR